MLEALRRTRERLFGRKTEFFGVTIQNIDELKIHFDVETGVYTFSGKTKPRADEFAKVRFLFDDAKRESE